MIKINLLPRKPRVLKTLWRDSTVLSLTLITLVIGLIALSLHMNGKMKRVKKDLQKTKKQIEDSNLDIEKIKKLKIDKEVLENKIGIINSLREKQGWPVRMLEDLSSAIPDHIWLQTLTNQGNFLRLEGYTASYNDVSSFMQMLSKSPYFRNIELENIQQSTFQGKVFHKFRLSCRIKVGSFEPNTIQ